MMSTLFLVILVAVSSEARKKKRKEIKPASIGLFNKFLEKAFSLSLCLVLLVRNSGTFIS